MLRQVLLFCLLIAAVEATTVALVSGNVGGPLIFASGEELTQFTEETNQGFTFQHGRLVVESSGYYFIYAQVWIEYYPGYNRNRLAITLNSKTTLSLLQKSPKSDYGSLYSGVVKYLSAGEYISLKAIYPSKLWMEPAHTFFGAHKID